MACLCEMPLKPTKPSASRFPAADAIAELVGYVDLGLAPKAVSLAGAILKQRPLSSVSFQNAVTALHIHADRLTAWKSQIEAAFAAMPQAQRRKAAPAMLAYYASIGDFEAASRYLPITRGSKPEHLYFAMETLLALGRIPEAKALVDRCMKAVLLPENQPKLEILLQALATYFCHCAEHEEARMAWQGMPLGGAFTENALIGVVETHLAQALLAADAGLAALADLSKNPAGETEIILPGNEKELIDGARKALLALRRKVAKTLPPARMKRLGMQPVETESSGNPDPGFE